jgi:hypothetical protein
MVISSTFYTFCFFLAHVGLLIAFHRGNSTKAVGSEMRMEPVAIRMQKKQEFS